MSTSFSADGEQNNECGFSKDLHGMELIAFMILFFERNMFYVRRAIKNCQLTSKWQRECVDIIFWK